MALSLGKTLTELDQLPESELKTWQLFYSEQPFGLWREDWRTGLMTAAIVNTVSNKSFKPLDFMVFFPEKNSESEDYSLLEDVVIV